MNFIRKYGSNKTQTCFIKHFCQQIQVEDFEHYENENSERINIKNTLKERLGTV